MCSSDLRANGKRGYHAGPKSEPPFGHSNVSDRLGNELVAEPSDGNDVTWVGWVGFDLGA